ncbi:MAG: AAA family ATPase, partial [Prevotellaceae bacterium]|nr:AAA family ATPase [Prevotellaceae bacterium]
MMKAEKEVKKGIRCLRVRFRYHDDTYLYVLPDEACPDAMRGEAKPGETRPDVTKPEETKLNGTFLDTILPDWTPEQPLRVRYGVPQVNAEFEGSCTLLWEGARLNLLDVAVDDAGVLTPSLLILEPDYLVDISSLAECFREFGDHPANYLLSRLSVAEKSAAILLGNIANLFLDEWIHAKETPDYMTCMQKAFSMYPIELAACGELHDKARERAFFNDCRRHFDHIGQMVTETFRGAAYGLDKADAVLEPSYICESLGIQGRLDYMQRDMSAFIEMKSGKADEYTVPGKVMPRANNRVQMLLYQAVLHYSMGRDYHKVQAYLLYTRYPLLYPARTSWAELRHVLDVRNRIVAQEYDIQLHNSLDYTAACLSAINPDTLNLKQIDTPLWRYYLEPSISSVANKIAALSPVERHYFYALYNFITKELYTSKSGYTAYEGRAGSSSLWLSTLEEKLDSGEILCDLTMVENHADDARNPCLLLACPACRAGMPADTLPDFRPGDAIVLYQRECGTDNVTNRMVFKGNIEHITDKQIGISLKAAQQNLRVLPAEGRYAVEHDFMDTTFRTMYRGLAAFMDANPDRRALLMNARQPRYDATKENAVATASDDFERITRKALAAEDCFLVIGPPGTGKTSRALRGMVETFCKEGKQLLLLSYTNRAVDEICKALAAITPAVDFIRMGGELACNERYRQHLATHVLASCSTRRAVRTRIGQCPVFVGTVATLSGKPELFRLKKFDVAIVDEATQILEPQLLGLLCARRADGSDAIGKFILIGDHKQLPAVVLQPSECAEVHDPALRGIGLLNLRDSLFERFYRTFSHGTTDAVGSSPFYDMLCRQGRMNEEVAAFPNRAFYG